MPKEYPKPSVTVDIIVFALENDRIKILLIQRKHDPFQGKWALPGGFVEMDETLSAAAYRELKEETGLTAVTLEQFRSFGDPGRDPRGRTITVAYHTLLTSIPEGIKGNDDAADAQWFFINELPELAFDHKMVLAEAISDLRARLEALTRAAACFSEELKISNLRAALLKNC
jgi:8-oxo-dGTP diphosphatase